MIKSEWVLKNKTPLTIALWIVFCLLSSVVAYFMAKIGLAALGMTFCAVMFVVGTSLADKAVYAFYCWLNFKENYDKNL